MSKVKKVPASVKEILHPHQHKKGVSHTAHAALALTAGKSSPWPDLIEKLAR